MSVQTGGSEVVDDELAGSISHTALAAKTLHCADELQVENGAKPTLVCLYTVHHVRLQRRLLIDSSDQDLNQLVCGV